MLFLLVFVLGSLLSLMSWKDVGSTLKRVLVTVDTKKKLKTISDYDYRYFLLAASILLGFVLMLLYAMYENGVIDYSLSLWRYLLDFFVSLDKNETQYTCSFGMSYQAVKCEVFTSINRSILYTVVQFSKCIQDAFSYNSFNFFKLMSVFALGYNSVNSFVSRINLFEVCKRSLNNSIILFYSLVFGLHAIHHWRDIVKAVKEGDKDVPDKDVAANKDVTDEVDAAVPCVIVADMICG